MDNWFVIQNIEQVDSPSLVIYKERVKENIGVLKSFVPDILSLRPHVKTHKSPHITKLLLEAGISKFKCATLAEAEMLALCDAPDILLSHQPVGPKTERLGQLVSTYKKSKFSCIVDDAHAASMIAAIFKKHDLVLDVFIDLNVGMNRTGIVPEKAMTLFDACSRMEGIRIIGLHAYDGHLRDPDLAIRKKECDAEFKRCVELQTEIEKKTGTPLIMVAGGTPTFPIHAMRKDVECSPGTFIYWDKGYQQILTEQPFHFAALVITRVISLPDDTTVCVDLGHKSIASENTITNRVYFLNAPDAIPVGHSEEHLVLQMPAGHSLKVGDVLYGIPYHICPTVALHDTAYVIENNIMTQTWETIARKRKISF